MYYRYLFWAGVAIVLLIAWEIFSTVIYLVEKKPRKTANKVAFLIHWIPAVLVALYFLGCWLTPSAIDSLVIAVESIGNPGLTWGYIGGILAFVNVASIFKLAVD